MREKFPMCFFFLSDVSPCKTDENNYPLFHPQFHAPQRESAFSLAAFRLTRSDARGSIDSRVPVSLAREEREREREKKREFFPFSLTPAGYEGSEERKRMVERRREQEERKGAGEKSQLEVIDFSN